MNRVALAAMRLQPLHKGHTRIISRMIEDFNTVIIGLGSADSPITKHDPWPIEHRVQMLSNIYGKRIKIIPLADIGAEQGHDDWINYVLEKIAKVGLPNPTDYFTGSVADSIWYKNKFWSGMATDSILAHPLSEKYFTVNKGEKLLRHLHIMDRSLVAIPAATDIRTSLETRDDSWTAWVPRVNWDLIKTTYPEDFKIKKS